MKDLREELPKPDRASSEFYFSVCFFVSKRITEHIIWPRKLLISLRVIWLILSYSIKILIHTNTTQSCNRNHNPLSCSMWVIHISADTIFAIFGPPLSDRGLTLWPILIPPVRLPHSQNIFRTFESQSFKPPQFFFQIASSQTPVEKIFKAKIFDPNFKTEKSIWSIIYHGFFPCFSFFFCGNLFISLFSPFFVLNFLLFD